MTVFSKTTVNSENSKNHPRLYLSEKLSEEVLNLFDGDLEKSLELIEMSVEMFIQSQEIMW